MTGNMDLIGPSSLILALIPMLFALGFAVLGVKELVLERRLGQMALCLLAAAFLGGLTGVRFYYHWQAYGFLAGLTPEKVSAVDVAGQRVDEPEKIADIVSALRRCVWFSPNHRPYGHLAPLAIEGDESMPTKLRAGIYTYDEAAVISISRGGGWNDGRLLCYGLPRILEQAGAPLPGREWRKVYDGGGWTAWYDPHTVLWLGQGKMSVWVRMEKDREKGKWSRVARGILDCAAGRMRFHVDRGIPEAWSWEYPVRRGSVSDSLRKVLCSEEQYLVRAGL